MTWQFLQCLTPFMCTKTTWKLKNSFPKNPGQKKKKSPERSPSSQLLLPRFILISPLPCVNVSLQYHYVCGIPPASIYGDLGSVFWGLRGPIISLSHYEPGQRENNTHNRSYIGLYLSLCSHPACLPSCLFVCLAYLYVRRVSCYRESNFRNCFVFFSFSLLSMRMCWQWWVTHPGIRIRRPAQFSRGHPSVHHGLCKKKKKRR